MIKWQKILAKQMNMYYSSPTSHKFLYFNSTAKIRSAQKSSQFSRIYPLVMRSLALSALSISAFIFAVVLIITPVNASTRDIAEDYHRLGYDAQLKDDYAKALGYYFKAAAVEPNNSSYWNDIGFIFESTGEVNSAEKAYLRAIRIDPAYVAPYANLGHLYRKKQNLVKAIYYFQKRIELGDPADPWTQKAREDLNDIYISTPLYRDRFLDAETKRLNLQTSQKTREVFKNQIRVANSEYDRGMVLLKQKRTEQAIKAFNDSLAFAPENPKVVQARNEAMRLLRAQQVSIQVEKAMRLLHAGHEQAAKQKFSEILSIIPNQPN